MLNKQSLIEWASSWVPEENRERFAQAFGAELQNWTPPSPKVVWCKHCPFAQHVHYPEGGKLVAPGCEGFEEQSNEAP